LGIFKAEAEQHLQSIDLYLQEAPIDHHGRPVTKELLRALHTMNGTARTADVPELWQIYGPLEAYAKERDGNDLVMPEKALTVLQDASDYARSLLTGLEAGVRYLPDNAAILTEIEALRADDPLAPPAPAPVVEEMEAAPPPIAATVELPPEVINARADMPGEQDMELVDIFLEEADEIMNASDATLQRWKENHEDRDAVSEFQRQLHTLKGGARMAGFSNIGHLSHAVESLTIAVVDGVVAPTGGMFDHLHQAMDRLSGMLDSARSQKPVQPAPELLTELERLRLGLGESTEPGEPAVEVELQVEAAPPPPVEEPEDPELGAPPLAEETPQAHEDEAADVVDLGAARENRAAQQEPRAPRAAPQELVRVRSDLLDNLVNYAGEVNIYHSRLEQQISGFRFNLGELEQTVHRLREQLRKLELETEAQIRSSYEREREREGDEVGVADFDPLELDRYSNIQQLSRALAESLNDLVSIEDFLGEQVRDAETLLLQQSRVSTDLQEGLMRTRMVQFTGMVPRLRRIVRQTAGELGRKVELNISGEGSELDRSVLERMIAPMEHMLRNAISHGIESPQERAARGKPEQGEIEIELGREGSEVVIRVSDDGAGINLEAVRAKARRMGLLESDTHLSDSDVMQLIMEPGFSTAQEVSQISGRGVGMDVVNSEIKQLNGSLQIESVEGKGTVFTIRLPFTLAINQALLVQTAEDLFAIPLTSIEGIVRYSTGDLRQKYEMENPLIDYAAHTYELKHLGTLFGVSTPSLDADNLFPVLLVRSGNQRIALQVEGLLGSREVVVKSVGPQIAQARGISGATILGDGRVVLILDIPALIRMGMGVRSVNQPIAEPDEADEEARRLTVMVVDDSITIRKVTSRMLERNDFGVMTAKDGVDAVAQLQEQIPDLMLLDIEMPRMDGYELAQHVRNDPRLHDIPIIMITSRTGEKHRQRALDIGVNRYLGKPYQEADLLENIQEVLGTQGELQGTSD
jgi:chemosensory pili system protein ChpA (sensor histidine kinase/response regulator)